ncbi:MAG: glycogen/starch synthase [Bacteroidota bacterium]|nr:glycogen/starch synthase [Bacteroidota bacterium]
MENKRNKILFISSEMSPFLESSPLAEIARKLPQAIQEQDNEVRILVPRFGLINERRNRLHEVVRLSGMNITIDDNDNPLTIKVASIPSTKMQVYFLDNEDFFHRKSLYGNEEEEFFKDNDERTIFFCKGALETVKKLGWYPDIIHCQGWMTSLIPLYLRTLYKDEPVFFNSKVVYSVFDNTFKANMGDDFTRKATLNQIEDQDLSEFGNGDNTSLQIGGVVHADAIVKCSESLDPKLLQTLDAQSNKPLIDHSEETIGETYSDLYNSLLSEN